MFDLLNLPGVKPVELLAGRTLTVIAELLEDDIPMCPVCVKPTHRHGRRTSIFADTPMQMQPVKLEIKRPRYRCGSCGKIITRELGFVDEKRRATKRLVDAIRQQCLATSFHAIAEQTGLAVNTVKNIAHDLIEELESTVRYETPVIMGINGIRIAGGHRCVITNLATNNIFQMLESHTQDHLKGFLQTLAGRERVEWVCTDMWQLFQRSFSQYLPNAKLVIDRRHIVKLACEALEEELEKHQTILAKDEGLHVRSSIRWLKLKRRSVLNVAEQEALGAIRQLFPGLATAYDVKEAFCQIYDEPQKSSAVHAFTAWENTLPKSELTKFSDLAKIVHNHHDDVFAYWDSPQQITIAYGECLSGLFKLSNRADRGYSYEIMRAKIVYAEHARKVGSGIHRIPASEDAVPVTTRTESVEYGPYIPALVELVDLGGLD